MTELERAPETVEVTADMIDDGGSNPFELDDGEEIELEWDHREYDGFRVRDFYTNPDPITFNAGDTITLRFGPVDL